MYILLETHYIEFKQNKEASPRSLAIVALENFPIEEQKRRFTTLILPLADCSNISTF